MTKGFASTADLGEKKVGFGQLGPELCAYTAGRDREIRAALQG